MRNHRSSLLLAAVVMLSVAAAGSCGVFTVVNTDDSGPGTLRQAILDANSHAGPDTIGFDIPETGVLFNGACWFIEPFSDLPEITDDWTFIDGTTQTARRGDKNSNGPEIYLSGCQGRIGSPVADGLTIRSSRNVVQGMIISCFKEYGILIKGDSAFSNEIRGNYIGTNFSGQDTLESPNGTGVILFDGPGHNTIGGTAPSERNVISGNRYNGIEFTLADSNRAIGNIIGADVYGTRTLGNGQFGVVLYGSAENDIGGEGEGEGNLVAGSGSHGIYVSDTLSVRNRIIGNRIGTNMTGLIALPNECGVAVHHGAKWNRIGPGNVIWNSTYKGVVVFLPETLFNTITRNSISGNADGGIVLLQNSNQDMARPIIELAPGGITGTSVPNAIVEIFSDTSGQGMTYEGTAVADGDGQFTWTGTPAGPFVTATATDAAGNTSAFSQAVEYTEIEQKAGTVPSDFTLYPNFPNPFNPSTSIRFMLRNPCRVKLMVFDLNGRELCILADANYPSGDHTVLFDASGLASGIYLLRFHTRDFNAVRKMLKVQ